MCTQGVAGTSGDEDVAADLAARARGDVPEAAAAAAPATNADALMPGDFLDADDVDEVLVLFALPFAMMCRSGHPSLLALRGQLVLRGTELEQFAGAHSCFASCTLQCQAPAFPAVGPAGAAGPPGNKAGAM